MELAPTGSKLPQDVVAHVVENAIESADLMEKAPKKLVTEVKTAIQNIDRTANTAYADAVNKFIDVVKPPTYYYFAMNDTKKILLAYQESVKKWERTNTDLWESLELWATTIEEMLIYKVLRQGLDGYGYVAWKHSSLSPFGITKIDTVTGNRLGYARNPGPCDQAIVLSDGSIVVGGTHDDKRCPVIFRWPGTGAASTDSNAGGAGFGLKWVKYFTDLPSFGSIAHPAVEGIQYDGINTLMVAVRDAKNDSVRNYRINLDTGLGDATGPGSVTNSLPTVAITSPANNATFTACANITITASAEDSDGAIAKVEFFRDDTKLGQSTTSPFSIVWNNATVGGYIIYARATDNSGAVRDSSRVNISVSSSGGTQLFAEDFSGDLSKWTLIKRMPNHRIEITTADGNPSPSVILDDYLNYGASIVSKQSFSFSGKNLEFSADMKQGDAAFNDQRYAVIYITKDTTTNLVDLCQLTITGSANPTQPNKVHASIRYMENGTEQTESSQYTSISNGDGWHRGKILIRADLKVEFYLDGQLIYTSQNALDPSYSGKIGVGAGSRKSLYDNFDVRTAKTLPTLTDGLVAYYPFTGNANDTSGNNYNGTVTSPTLASDRFGTANTSYLFNGTSDFIGLPYYFNDLGATGTVSIWFRFNSTFTVGSPDQNLLIADFPGFSHNLRIAFSSGNGKLSIMKAAGQTSATAGNVYSGRTTWQGGIWYNMCFAFDSNDVNLYVNGQLETNEMSWGTNVALHNLATRCFIGKHGAGDYFNGRVDDVRVYNRTLSSAEALALFNTPSAADLTAPVISAVTATNITTSTAVITWTTDENSSSVVEYGPTTAYGSIASVPGSVTNHSVPLSGLASGTTYHFRVKSADAVGNEGTTTDQAVQTWSGNMGSIWVQATPNANFPARCNFGAAVYQNKMWIFGGTEAGGNKNDVWNSTDGVTWTQVAASTAWSARHMPAVAVFQNKMWLMGGYDTAEKKDVWYSTDGVTWTQATANASWFARKHAAGAVFDNKMWVIGGSIGGGGLNDFWYSTDGTNCTAATNNAAWSDRAEPEVVVNDGRMWLMAGGNASLWNKDVWYTTDGATWTNTTTNPGWNERIYFFPLAYNNRIWVFAGSDQATVALANDVWYSQ